MVAVSQEGPACTRTRARPRPARARHLPMDAEENTASGALCALVARGQALLVELLRLSDRVPPPFRAGAPPKYAAVLFDFAYLTARAQLCGARAFFGRGK